MKFRRVEPDSRHVDVSGRLIVNVDCPPGYLPDKFHKRVDGGAVATTDVIDAGRKARPSHNGQDRAHQIVDVEIIPHDISVAPDWEARILVCVAQQASDD